MRLSLREEMQSIDHKAVSERGLSEEILVERAGSLMAEKIIQLPGLGTSHRLAVLCGPGNNGNDALVVARKLLEKYFSVIDVWCLKAGSNSLLYQLNIKRFKNLGGKVSELDSGALEKFDFNKYDLLIDGLFGTGLNRALDSALVKFIEKINQQKVSVIALDIPTGLDANRGIFWGAAIQALHTLTCGLAKPGFYLQEGPTHVGKIEILNIGFPKDLVENEANSTFLIGKNSAIKVLQQKKLKRIRSANKSYFGKLLILAGSPNMKGAAGLAAEAAARMGVGYVTVASPFADVMKKLKPDFLQTDFKNLKNLDFSKFSSVAIGPGLGTGSETLQLLLKLKAEKIEKVLIDADALTVAAQKKLWPMPATWLLTPHAGELSRILGKKSVEIEEDRLRFVREAQKITGAQVLLKGLHSVLSTGEKNYIIGSGNVALAKAGTGDVLTGFISSLMAQGLATEQAAVLGSYLHGKIADEWLRRGGSPRTLMASDLPQLLNQVLREME